MSKNWVVQHTKGSITSDKDQGAEYRNPVINGYL